jgi:succinate dehydrogenase / fumarate reductase flavoprotein subunit
LTLPVRKFDAIIVGAGGAGMRCSLAARRKRGFRSQCCRRSSRPARTRSPRKGGIGASLGNMSEDNWLWHMYDTIKGSDWLGRPGRDRIHVPHGAAGRVRARALRHAVRPQPDGTIYQRPFGGHSANFGEKPGAARVRRGRPHRSRDAAHAVPAQRARAHAVLREWMALDLVRNATATSSAWSRTRWKRAT